MLIFQTKVTFKTVFLLPQSTSSVVCSQQTLIFHMCVIPHRRNYKGFEPLEMATSADAFEDFVAASYLTHQLKQFRTTERKKI